MINNCGVKAHGRTPNLAKKEYTMNIIKITILTGRGTDRIYLHTNILTTLYMGNGSVDDKTCFSCEQTAGKGTEWVSNFFPDIPVEIIRIT